MKKCKICSKNEVVCKELCQKHYNQYRRHKKILDSNQQTIHDGNEIREYEDYAEIDTYDKRGNVNYTYKCDIDDVKYLVGNKWRTSLKGHKLKRPYLVTRKSIYFHRLVMGSPNYEIDHINRDTTDNRKINLRKSNRTQQSLNTDLRSDNTQNIKGVYYSTKHKSYHVEFQMYGKRYFSKHFKTKAEAVYMRYLFECFLLKPINIPVFDITPYIDLLTDEQKTDIDRYFKFRSKEWVRNVSDS